MTFRVSSDPRGPLRAVGPRVSARIRAALALLLGLVTAVVAPVSLAFEPFTVKDIRVEGVQRTDAGTVFNYLPIKVGDRVDDEKASAAVKALYATGFFRDVSLQVENGILVVIDFGPHALEFLREEQAHCRLGFADADVDDWCRSAGLDPDPSRRLPGDPLTVVIWTAHRQAATDRSLATMRPAVTAAPFERVLQG